jgi:hemolysin D
MVFQAAWAHRAELAGPARMADEIAFLPAALSLQDTPVHPSPRRLAWGLMSLFVIALIWSIFGQVDIVAVAPGRIIVSERTKVIQPLEASVVKRVLVRDGDRVIAGQVLVELDPTIATAESSNVNEQLLAVASEMLRTQALLTALSPPMLPTPSVQWKGVQTSLQKSEIQAQLKSEWLDIKSKLAKLDADMRLRQAEIGTVKETIAKLEATVPMAQIREADFKRLVGEGFISSHATQDKTRERVEMERDLVVQRAKLQEAQSSLIQAEQSKTAYTAETLHALSDRHAQASTKYGQLQADASKATQRQKQTQLTSPVSGVIQQLAVHSVGGVVTSAQALMVVVPEAGEVTAEVTIANQDIGFVSVGQTAAVKLETFSYTKYGTVQAEVRNVSADAVTDDKKGSYYPATIVLLQRDMLIDGKHIALSPGMNITAEIKTGRRRIIEYLLSPVQRTGNESLRER